MPKSLRGFALAGLALCLGVSVGCGEPEEKLYRVSGAVTFDGKPVAMGLIHFDPDSTKGTDGAQGFANIVDGKYDTALEGVGIRGGSYNIRVNGFDGKVGPEAPFGQALFPEHLAANEFPKEDSTFDLHVKKK